MPLPMTLTDFEGFVIAQRPKAKISQNARKLTTISSQVVYRHFFI